MAVIGAGFGGLGAALALAERGFRPVVFEALKYPGGCASTFKRGQYRFEAGATLFSGLGEGQLFARWVDKYALDVTFAWPDPVVDLRSPGMRLPLHRDRHAFVSTVAVGPNAENIRRFLAFQREVADVLWPAIEDVHGLLRLERSALLRHARHSWQFARLLRWMGRPLIDVLRHFSVEGERALMLWVRALSQITVQCGPEEAEALFALAALDYVWRGTGHVVGGIGALAAGLVSATEQQGGTFRFAERVLSVRSTQSGFHLRTTRGELQVPYVVANVLPSALPQLLGENAGGSAEEPKGATRAARRLRRLGDRVRESWGAAMLYGVLRAPENASASACHFELVADDEAPFIEGNHVFVSISGADETSRAPEGLRTATLSTHVHIRASSEQAAYIDAVQERMRSTFRGLLPEWDAGLVHVLPGSPRTFARFTRRPEGYVGGIPRRAGLHNYRDLRPLEATPGLWLVGDSGFPGQSTLATALGGIGVASAISRRASERTARRFRSNSTPVDETRSPGDPSCARVI